jgi:hypothetical protein
MGAYVRPSKEMEVSLLFHPKDENWLQTFYIIG